MIRTTIDGLRDRAGETVTIAGWAQTLRLQRAMQFVVVHRWALRHREGRAGSAFGGRARERRRGSREKRAPAPNQCARAPR